MSERVSHILGEAREPDKNGSGNEVGCRGEEVPHAVPRDLML